MQHPAVTYFFLLSPRHFHIAHVGTAVASAVPPSHGLHLRSSFPLAIPMPRVVQYFERQDPNDLQTPFII